jgi:hypothetical protein
LAENNAGEEMINDKILDLEIDIRSGYCPDRKKYKGIILLHGYTTVETQFVFDNEMQVESSAFLFLKEMGFKLDKITKVLEGGCA